MGSIVSKIAENIQNSIGLQKNGAPVCSNHIPDKDVLSFIVNATGCDDIRDIYWVDIKEKERIPNLKGKKGFGNTQRINDIRRINKYFEAVNERMSEGQYIIACLETKEARKERILNKFIKPVAIPYYVLDFILKRVLPKWKPTRQIYFMITKGRNRVLSLPESLGRLISCGFKIVEHKKITYKTWIVAKKGGKPAFDMQPTYGALIRLERVGKGGKLVKVHKLRTMYPYSEYLQEYIYEKYDLEEGGKFNNDFRNTSYGKLFRKYWIDELPMFINFFRGEMKLVGVRPLSEHYFSLYPEDLQELRVKVKPGLVPPYYADMPEGLEEIQESERNYLEAYLEKPIRTDMRYFFMTFYNIIIKGARSK